MYKSLALLALLPSTFAHFLLNYPPTLGFDDDAEGDSPCGGADISVPDNATELTVGAFAIALQSTHPQANWLYRYSTATEAPFNWTNIYPVVAQSGLGDFCLPALNVPDSLVGQSAIVQVVQSAVDGNLYQCAGVRFIAGSTTTPPQDCTNATGVTATLTGETTVDGADNTSDTSASATSSAAAATSSTANGGMMNVAGGLLAVLPAGLLLL